MNKRQHSSENYLDSKKFEKRKTIIILTVLFCIAFVTLQSSYENIREIQNQLKQNLEDVANQNAVILQSKINSKYQLLLSLSEELTDVTEENIMDKLSHFEPFLDEMDLKRFAFSFPGGMSYSTDGGVEDLSYREFYQQGMNGHCCITGILSDALQEAHTPINIMTIPVYDNAGKINGVFGVAYDAQTFNESLQINSFDGQGYCYIITSEGLMMSSPDEENLQQPHNFFDESIAADAQNVSAIKELRSQISHGEPSSGTLYLSEKTYYCCVPVELMEDTLTWYVLTMVPSSIVTQRSLPIQFNQFKTILFVGILITIGALVITYFIKQSHKQLNHMAYEDMVTGGANYAKFRIDMRNRYTTSGYLIAMDIVNFNDIIIAAGENAGNTMLKEVWQIIDHSLNDDDLAAHARDDNFILFLTEKDEKKLIQRMESLSEQIREKAKIFHVYGVQAGYGIYHLTQREPLENAYSKACVAREHALVNPEWHYAFYSEDNRQKIQYEKSLEELFPSAIKMQQFEVWYQPKYSAFNYKIVGSEALVRWRKEDGGMISPGEFIPLFERNGMIQVLDEYMFYSVCRQQRKWLDEGKTIYPVSINISRNSLYHAGIEQRYHEIIKEFDIDPSYIQIEVTETVVGGRKDIRELLNKFRKMGLKILMDDFGTGYSSLATLSTQCFDTLKLDKTLIDQIGSKEGEVLLHYVIHMGQSLGLHITAEGVEEESQLSFLQSQKCDDIQGFYFSRPLPVKDYEAILTQA